MTTTESLQAVVAFWAAQLGCGEAQLAQPHTSVVHAGPDLAGYRGATVVFRPPACVLAVPADWYEPVSGRIGRRPPAEVFDTVLLRRVFGSAVEQVIGLAAGGVMQYRTLQANLPSVAIARSLGFQRFALTLAVRLTPPR
jgi:hypothetical protein